MASGQLHSTSRRGSAAFVLSGMYRRGSVYFLVHRQVAIPSEAVFVSNRTGLLHEAGRVVACQQAQAGIAFNGTGTFRRTRDPIQLEE